VPADPAPRRSSPIVFVVALVAAALVLILLVVQLPGGDSADETDPAATSWPLTGEPMTADPQRPALLVKISNSPEARPWTGIEDADVVYEELVEGGVTRFIAVLHSRLPPVLGPMRSARPVDIQVISGFGNPGFAHSGAREEVRALLAEAPAVSITEGAPGFFRDDGTYASNPYAPHNLFLRPDEALDAVADGGADPLGDLGWRFDDEPPADSDGVGPQLEVAMSEWFTTGWSYDAGAGVYRRSQNGEPSLVTGEGEIGAANVVVLVVRHYLGDSGFPETDVVGEGDALVLRDGQRYRARWSKPTATDALEVLTSDGEVFAFKPGPTWILLPDELPATATDADASGE
jgi:hypothetical protein